MKLTNLIQLVALTLPLQGCWFIFIPGSVIDKVSDSMTGAEGTNCVGANAKVGDRVRMPDGSTGTIKSLSGTSIRCKDPQLPIRALLELSNDKTRKVASTPYASNVNLALPAGWEKKPLTESMTEAGTILHAINRTKDIGLYLIAIKSEGITDLMEFANSKRADQSSRLANPQQSEVSPIEIHGRKAFRFDVTGDLKTGPKMTLTYRTIVIEGSPDIAILNAWTTAANFERQKETIELLAENVSGLQ